MAAYLSVIRSVTTTTHPVNTLDLFHVSNSRSELLELMVSVFFLWSHMGSMLLFGGWAGGFVLQEY